MKTLKIGDKVRLVDVQPADEYKGYKKGDILTVEEYYDSDLYGDDSDFFYNRHLFYESQVEKVEPTVELSHKRIDIESMSHEELKAHIADCQRAEAKLRREEAPKPHELKVGDYVRAKASHIYNITKEGWEGVVVSLETECDCDCIKVAPDINSDKIFTVKSEYFEKIEPPRVTQPEYETTLCVDSEIGGFKIGNESMVQLACMAGPGHSGHEAGDFLKQFHDGDKISVSFRFIPE